MLQIGVSHWLTNSYTMLSQPDYFIYNSLIGEAHDEPYTQSVPIQYNSKLLCSLHFPVGFKFTNTNIKILS